MAINEPVYTKIVGPDDFTELRPRRVWSRVDGVSTEKRYVGPSDRIRDLFNDLTNSPTTNGADEISEDFNGANGELVVRIADDSGGEDGGVTELNAVWELRTNTVQKPIESRREFDSLNVLDNNTSKKRKIEDAARNAQANPYPSDAAAAKLYAYYGIQMLDYVLSDLLLTKSVTVSNRSTITAIYTGLNRVTTIEDINPPSVLLGTLTSLTRQDGTAGAWEWLYLGPQVRQVSKTKYQISYTWHGADRWAKIYGGSYDPERPT